MNFMCEFIYIVVMKHWDQTLTNRLAMLATQPEYGFIKGDDPFF